MYPGSPAVVFKFGNRYTSNVVSENEHSKVVLDPESRFAKWSHCSTQQHERDGLMAKPLKTE